jgi:hypothetical protein
MEQLVNVVQLPELGTAAADLGSRTRCRVLYDDGTAQGGTAQGGGGPRWGIEWRGGGAERAEEGGLGGG